jgi:aldose 1-epimerase
MIAPSDNSTFAQTMVGDEYDTSPYDNTEVKGISTRTYITNMVAMIFSLQPKDTTLSGLDPQRFVSKVEGKATALHVLRNSGMEACITNYGARLVSLMVPDRDGRLEDVVLGFDNIDDYHLRKQNFGSVVGRYIGRIKNASFMLDGVPYLLQKTGSNHISHGGYPGFADKVWEVVGKSDSTLCLQYVSPDGENGFPGTLTVKVTYTLAGHALAMDIEATTDKPTVVNLSNHHFFNIAGDASSSVLDQQLSIDSKYIATYDKSKNLDGNFMRVKNTPFDFITPKKIGSDIDIYDEQMSITKGYDHSFVLRHGGDIKFPAATLYDEESGREMTVYTTEPVLHLYTANGLNGSMVGKKGVAYQKQTALCLETMHLADSPNQSAFPSTVLRPGETYHSQTVFQFSEKTPKKRNLLSSILIYSGAASLTGLGIVGLFSLVK